MTNTNIQFSCQQRTEIKFSTLPKSKACLPQVPLCCILCIAKEIIRNCALGLKRVSKGEERAVKVWNFWSFLPTSTCYPFLTGGNLIPQNESNWYAREVITKYRWGHPNFVSKIWSTHSIQDHFLLLFEMNCGFQVICQSLPLSPSHFLG